MTKEQLDQLWELVAHQPRCRTQMVSPFEAECDCCDVVLMSIFDAGVAAEREACAQVADSMNTFGLPPDVGAAIRARSNAQVTGASPALMAKRPR